MRRDAGISLLAIGLYSLLIVVGLAHHELWLDESHHWLLARDSRTLAELWANTRYEGHPILWSLMLYGITRFTSDPAWMQALQGLIAISAAWFFVKRATFQLWIRIAFLFSYFMVFEYALISRNYMPGVLFLFAACDFWARRKVLPFYLMLGLVFQTHMLFMVPAFAFFLVDVFHQVRKKEATQELWLGIVVFAVLAGIGIWQTVPPTDTVFFDPISKLPLAKRLVKGIAFPMKGWLAIPDFRTLHFWNSNLLVNLSKPAASVVAVAAFALPLLLLRSTKALAFLYLTLLGGQVFFFITQRGATRFDGMAMVALIVALWIERTENPVSRPALQTPLIYGLLGLQTITGLFAWQADIRLPFTGSKQTADFITSNRLDRYPIAGVTCDATAVCAYLPQKIWLLCDGGYGSFCRWNNLSCGDNAAAQIPEMLTNFMWQRDEAIFVTTYELPPDWDRNLPFRVTLLFRSGDAILRNSGYFVYQISR